MSYYGFERLRTDVAALENAMCDLRQTLNRFEQQYNYQAEALPVLLASQTLRRINELYLKAYCEVLTLDESFKD